MAGTNKKKKFIFSKPAIILRNTQLPDNIGMSARSMVNYGFKDLRIVKPKVKWPNKKADSASAGAFDIINKNTKIYSNIEDSFKGIDIIFATSVRNRDLENIVLSPREAVKIAKYKYKNNKIGFLFGPEKAGLNNEDLSEANYIIQIPTNPSFGSLNIAMAVNIICYEWYLLENDSLTDEKLIYNVADKKKIYLFKKFLISTLYKTKFLKDRLTDKKLEINVKNIFSKKILTNKEILILYGIIKNLKKYKK